MWLFTIYGFFSVVCATKRSTVGPAVEEVDTSQMMIRCRVRTQLELLRSRYGLENFKISDSDETDYRYRIIIPRSRWVALATDLANDICYSNFKAECADTHGYSPYVAKLHSVWNLMQEPDSLYYQGADRLPKGAPKRAKTRRK